MSFINQHSFTIVAAVLLLAILLVMLRGGLDLNKALALAALLLGLGFSYWLFSPARGSGPGGDVAQDIVGAGTPVLLEFQSPY